MIEVGCIHGRFQPFHNGHFEYMLAGLSRCNRLIIGITQYERGLPDEDSPAHRMITADNPFSFLERVQIIRAVITANKIDHDRCEIVPFPIHDPAQISGFIPEGCLMLTTVYDQWNLEKIERLREAGYEVDVLWQRDYKAYEGKVVRDAIRNNDDKVRSMLPPGCYEEVQLLLTDRKI